MSPPFGPNGKIAFDSDRLRGLDQIFVMDADGSHQHPVTHTGTSILNTDADWGVG